MNRTASSGEVVTGENIWKLAEAVARRVKRRRRWVRADFAELRSEAAIQLLGRKGQPAGSSTRYAELDVLQALYGRRDGREPMRSLDALPFDVQRQALGVDADAEAVLFARVDWPRLRLALSPAQRLAIEGWTLGQRTHTQIAKQLGVSRPRVTKVIHKGLAALRKTLRDEGYPLAA